MEINETIKDNIKEELLNLQTYYNMYIKDYELNGEEDFNHWLNIFKEKEEQ